MKRVYFPRLFLFCALGVPTLAGCGGMKRYPVAGTATLDGKPLSGCAVAFNPDASKGNTLVVACFARPDSEGRYQLKTDTVKASEGGSGAPLGWYKVSLMTGLPGDPEIKVKPVFLDANKSPISIEIVEKPEPGHYDLKFTSK
jgi:hypothetical protein